MRVFCTYSVTEEEDADTENPTGIPAGRVKLTAKYFDKDIAADSFISLRVSSFLSPRSTAPTDSFQFTSYDGLGVVLDSQKYGLVAQATEFNEIKTVLFESTSQVIGQL